MTQEQRTQPEDTGIAITLDEYQTKGLLRQYRIPVVPERLTHTIEEAVAAARKMGYPVVLKAVGPTLLHKSDRGLVHLQLKDDLDVRRAARIIEQSAGRQLEAWLVQPWIRGARELLAGIFRDPQFGPVITLGLGGVLAEALDRVAFGLAPLTSADAREMVTALQAEKLLAQCRGEKAVKSNDLTDLLLALSRLAVQRADITELDINPIRITPQGDLCAVDALAVLNKTAPPPPAAPPVPPDAIGALFHPRAIAFIGASGQFGKWGHMLPSNTIAGGFQGDIHLVNPKGGTLFGRKVHTRLDHIPHPVDLAVVTVPAHHVQSLIPQCRAKGIRYMVLVSSGFSETGPTGEKLEKQLVAAARNAGLLILGPNTMGIANPHQRLFCTGSNVAPLPGGTAVVAQSGNMGTQLLAFAERQGIGIRGFSGSGNEAMITIEDYLEGFEVDALTRTVLLYVESIKNGRRFFECARRLSAQKPIVLLKGGQSDAGTRAATSHTGALTSDRRVFDAMCRQAGIVKVEKPMELLDLAAAFASVPLPQGPRVAIMTLGGGWGVVTADLCSQNQLVLPPLSNTVRAAIDAILPPYWSRANPVDMVGNQDPTTPLHLVETLAQWEGCDAVLHLGVLGRLHFMDRLSQGARKSDPACSPQVLSQLRQSVIQFENDFIHHTVMLMEQTQKPIIGVRLLSETDDKTVLRVAGAAYKGLFYDTPERAVYALAKLLAYHRHISHPSEPS